MITIFENFKEPDLRELGEFVRCIKSYKKLFIKDNIYKVAKKFGDPQRAIEEFKIDYTPIDCISMVHISDDDGTLYRFAVNYERYTYFGEYLHFFDYFELMEESSISKKYNL